MLDRTSASITPKKMSTWEECKVESWSKNGVLYKLIAIIQDIVFNSCVNKCSSPQKFNRGQ